MKELLYYTIFAIILYFLLSAVFENFYLEQENFDPSLVPVSSIVTLAKVAQKLVNGNGTLTNPGNLQIGAGATTPGNLTVTGNSIVNGNTGLGGSLIINGNKPTSNKINFTGSGINQYHYGYLQAGNINMGPGWGTDLSPVIPQDIISAPNLGLTSDNGVTVLGKLGITGHTSVGQSLNVIGYKPTSNKISFTGSGNNQYHYGYLKAGNINMGPGWGIDSTPNVPQDIISAPNLYLTCDNGVTVLGNLNVTGNGATSTNANFAFGQAGQIDATIGKVYIGANNGIDIIQGLNYNKTLLIGSFFDGGTTQIWNNNLHISGDNKLTLNNTSIDESDLKFLKTFRATGFQNTSQLLYQMTGRLGSALYKSGEMSLAQAGEFIDTYRPVAQFLNVKDPSSYKFA
jgi:hypothetical protein